MHKIFATSLICCAIGTSVGGQTPVGFNIHFDANDFCGGWNIVAPEVPEKFIFGDSPVVGEVLEACISPTEEFTINGESVSYQSGDCDLVLASGSYMLELGGLHPAGVGPYFTVSENGAIEFLVEGAKKLGNGHARALNWQAATATSGEIKLNLIEVSFDRGGFAGLIWIEGIHFSNAQCPSGKKHFIPRAAMHQVGFGTSLHSWMSLDSTDIIHSDARYGVWSNRGQGLNQTLGLEPVLVHVDPIGKVNRAKWTFDRAESTGKNEFREGGRIVQLIPGRSYSFVIENVKKGIRVDFSDPCTLTPNVVTDPISGVGFELRALCQGY